MLVCQIKGGISNERDVMLKCLVWVRKNLKIKRSKLYSELTGSIRKKKFANDRFGDIHHTAVHHDRDWCFVGFVSQSWNAHQKRLASQKLEILSSSPPYPRAVALPGSYALFLIQQTFLWNFHSQRGNPLLYWLAKSPIWQGNVEVMKGDHFWWQVYLFSLTQRSSL